jgi:hypothetical protein
MRSNRYRRSSDLRFGWRFDRDGLHAAGVRRSIRSGYRLDARSSAIGDGMTLFLVIAGFALLAAGTWRQSALIFGNVPRPSIRHALLGGGFVVLAGSLVPVLDGDDPSRALVEWFGQLTLGAIGLLVAMWLRQQKRR